MNKNDSTQYYNRLATKEDLKEILHWLKDDHESALINNKDLIQQGQQEERLVALIEKGSNKAVAFCLGGLTAGCGVFAVHPEMRGNGIGNILFQICLESARKKHIAGLSIQCNPKSSIPFWEKCGFQILDKYSSNIIRAVYPISREYDLPGIHKTVKVTFELNHEWDQEWQSPIPFTTDAEMVEDGIYQLKSRFVQYVPSQDFMIRILIDGKEINNKKIKYSADCGVEYHAPFILADKIIESQSE